MMTNRSANEQRGQWNSCGQSAGAPSSGIDRWELLECVAELRKPLGLSDRDLRILQAHLSVLPKGPLLAAKPNLSFMSGAEVCRRAMGVEEHSRLRAEQRLEKVGLISRRMSANRRRFAVRDGEGHVHDGYGIDLTPLLERADELMQLREKYRAAEAHKSEMRSALRARLRDMEELLRALATDAQALFERIQQWRTKLRRRTLALLDLKAMSSEIGAAETELNTALPTHDAPVEDPPVNRGSERLSNKKMVEDEQNVGHIESDEKESNNSPTRSRTSHRPVPPQPRLQRDWKELTNFETFYPDPPHNSREMLYRISEFGGFLGLREPVLSAAVARLGLDGAAITLDYIAGKIEQILNPHGYLESLLQANAMGKAIAGGRLPAGWSSR